MTWKLQTITSEFTGQEVSIDRDMLIGRHQDADIVLQSGDVSRRHAALLLKDDALWVQDLKSSNGTFVNDVRVDHEVLLKNGDILQFAGQKFSVLEPAKTIEELQSETAVNREEDVESLITSVPDIQQPSEAIAVSETAQESAKEKTVAEKMIDQGMPDLKERDSNVQVSPEGMPRNVGVPKPAPIPEGVNIQANPEPKPIPVEQPVTRVEQELEQQKNASVGLISIVVLIIVAIIAWLIFK